MRDKNVYVEDLATGKVRIDQALRHGDQRHVDWVYEESWLRDDSAEPDGK